MTDADKQELLELTDVKERLEKVFALMESEMGMLRFLRLFRLIRLLRLLKVGEYVANLEEKFEINLTFLRIATMLLKLVFLSHILACFWFYTAQLTGLDPEIRTWVSEYDAGKVKETLLQLGLGVCVMCVMHFKWGYVQPLMIHCLLQPSQVWDCKAVQVHLRGKEAEYPRPWKLGGGSPIEAWAQRKKEEMEAAAKEAKAEEAKKSD